MDSLSAEPQGKPMHFTKLHTNLQIYLKNVKIIVCSLEKNAIQDGSTWEKEIRRLKMEESKDESVLG